MLITDTANRLRGYVVITADGFFLERFLNICTRRGVFLWNVRRTGNERIRACVGIRDFFRLRPIAHKTRTRVSISRRCGLPFLLHRYRRRRAAAVGIALFCAILWFCSAHVMGIDICGNERIPTETVTSALRSFGVYRGAAIGKIDRREVQNKMMTELDDIAWVGVNIKGSRVYVEIKERLATVRNTDANVPCNIVAAKDGIVRLMDIKEGQSVAGVGDMVEKGDLLVSGVVDSNSEGMRYVHSFGGVYAATSYKKEREYPLEYTEKIYTGKTAKRYSAEIFGKQIPLMPGKGVPFENSDTAESVRNLPIPNTAVHCTEYAEYTPEKRVRSVEQAVSAGRDELFAELDGEIPGGAEVKNKNVSFRVTESRSAAVTVEYECIEDIALQTPIDKIENMNYDIGSDEKQKNERQ